MKNKNAQTVEDSFGKILVSSKRKPNLNDKDRRNELFNNNFQNILKNNKIKHYSGKSSLGASFAKRFNRTIRQLLKRPVFEKGGSNWIEVLPTITKQYNIRVHFSTELQPIQASLKNNERFAYNNLLDKRKKIEPKFQINDLVRVANLKRTISKSDAT